MAHEDQAFIAHLHELLDPLGHVAARAMFGGWGVYLDGIIIGIVDEGRFYLKVDAASEPRFVAAGSAPFVYMSKDGPMAMSYWSAPDETLDSAGLMAPWARLALDAALRKRAAKPPKKAKAISTRKQSKISETGGTASKATVAKKTTPGAKTIATSMAAKAKRPTGRRTPR